MTECVWTIGLLRPGDLPRVMELQAAAYPDVGHDSLEVFADKLSRYPPGGLGLWEEDRLEAYLFSHPWRLHELAVLDRPSVIPSQPDCYYLHDLAVGRRGQGQGRALVTAALRQAAREGLHVQALVAVHGTQPFWSRFGFRELLEPSADLQAGLREYSPEAVYMVRRTP